MDKSPAGRITNAEHLLIGKWFNESIGIFFNGSDEPNGTGILFIGDPNLAIFAQARYKVLIKGLDLYIQLILNDATPDKKIRDYKVRISDGIKEELILESPEGSVLSLNKY